MIGLIFCIAIFEAGFAILLYREFRYCSAALLGGIVGIFVGILAWFVISIPIFKTADVKLIDSKPYKLEAIGEQYWITDSEGRKTVYYVNEGKELRTKTVSPDRIEYSDAVKEPTLMLETYEYLGTFVNIWCGSDTNFTKYKIVMPNVT